MGRTCFGITPERPLKSLIIQAENDRGDVSEMVQGSLTGLQINVDDDAFTALEKRVVIVTESVNTGDKFTEAVRHLIGKHKPDLVWLDPLLSFIGDDISRQEVCSHFLRNLLNPIAYEHGVAWMMMHHTPKPAADPQSKAHWDFYDHSYQGTCVCQESGRPGKGPGLRTLRSADCGRERQVGSPRRPDSGNPRGAIRRCAVTLAASRADAGGSVPLDFGWPSVGGWLRGDCRFVGP